jgi:O-antigen/teichoic acid export membrane protein
VAVVVFIAGLGCYFILPYFVKDAVVSWSYLHLIYFLQLASVIAGYFLSYRRTIYIATQQEYRCVQIDLYTTIVIQIAQLGLLALLHNYIIYLCLQLLTNIIANIIIARKSDKEYPYLKSKYSISKAEIDKRNMFSDIRNFLVHQVSYAVYGGTDNIIISAFCGIRNVALYGNYVMVQRGVLQVLFYKLLNPIQATIGNIVYSNRKKEELWEQFKILDVFSFFFASYIGLGFFIFYQPFIQLWMGKEYLLSNAFVALFSITIYLGAVLEMVYKYRTVFGDYKQDRNFMIASAVLNLAFSIPGAKLFGISGIQFGTFVAFLPIAMGRIRFVVKNYFEQSMSRYLLKHTGLFILVIGDGVICYLLTAQMPVSILGFLERGVVWLFVPLISNLLVYCRNPYFKELMGYVKRIIRIATSKVKKNK